jgi:hypothetical protein
MKQNTLKNLWALGGLITLMNILPQANAAILTNVPMQGGMVMPELSYQASDGVLRVQMDPTVPQLTPLLVSHPGDHFDPADPWYDALDPSRQGLAFSKRYGFVMASVTDPLPIGTGIWIRKLSSSPELGFYRAHAMSLPKLMQPIFGTDGTTNVYSWNGTMFHPCVTAPAGTNTYTATFEAFLVDTTTGVAVPGSSTGPFLLNWTTVPDGRPVLNISRKIVIEWPASVTNYVLEYTDALPSSTWMRVTNTPVMLDGQPAVILDINEAEMFFRMSPGP